MKINPQSLTKYGFIYLNNYSSLMWVGKSRKVHEIIVEYCIGDCCVGYFVSRDLQDAKYRCKTWREVLKTVKELKQLYYK